MGRPDAIRLSADRVAIEDWTILFADVRAIHQIDTGVGALLKLVAITAQMFFILTLGRLLITAVFLPRTPLPWKPVAAWALIAAVSWVARLRQRTRLVVESDAGDRAFTLSRGTAAEVLRRWHARVILDPTHVPHA